MPQWFFLLEKNFANLTVLASPSPVKSNYASPASEASPVVIFQEALLLSNCQTAESSNCSAAYSTPKNGHSGSSFLAESIICSIFVTLSGYWLERSCCSMGSFSKLKRKVDGFSFKTSRRISFQLSMRTACLPPLSWNSQYKYSCFGCSFPNREGKKDIPSTFRFISWPTNSAKVGKTSQNAEI